MSEFIKYLSVLIGVFSYLWINKLFWDNFLVRRKISFTTVLPWIFLFVCQFATQYFLIVHTVSISAQVTLMNTLAMLLVVFFSYEPKGLETFFLLIFFCLLWTLTELALYLLFRSLGISPASMKPYATFFTLLIMLSLTHIISLLSNKQKQASIPNRLAFTLLLLPVCSLYIMLVHLRLYTMNNYFLTLSVFFFLLLINMIIFHIYTRLSQYFLNEKENAIHAEQLSMVARNMEEQKKLMEEFYEEKHNLINELTALRGSINQDSNADIIRNLDGILDCYHGMGNISSSGNSTVDAIINAKYATAKEYGITFHLQICVPEEMSIAPHDLGIVIGNALDNAVTAVRECALTEKSLHISMGVKKNALILVVKNPYEHALKRNQDGDFQSTKPEKNRHGYGIRSIRRIAKAYDGDIMIDTDNGLFILTVVLNFKDL